MIGFLISLIIFLLVAIAALVYLLILRKESATVAQQAEATDDEAQVVNMALNIIAKNEILKSISKKLARLSSDPAIAGNHREIIQLREEVLIALQMDKERDTFELFVEERNRNFYRRLNNRFPNLTNSERRLAALLRLNLSSKEIANLLNISPKSVEMNRYRFRKKIQIGKDVNLCEFICEI